jgi:uncharacterized protein YaiE (UPF0345 family)
MANRRFIDFPIAASVGDNDIVLIWQDGLNKQTTKATLLQGSPSSLAGLTDVDISALTNGQILQYNSTTSKWENVDRTDINLSELGDVTIVAPANGQVLVYNSSTSKWENSSAGYVPYTGAVTTVNLGAQSILAGSFVRAGGTSAQFLKADGSVDSSTYGTGTVTSVALTMPTAFSVANSPITTTGTLAVTATGTTSQYIRGDGSLATFPALTGFVPYTGATADVNLGTHDLTAERGTFENNGSSDTLTVNHTSGSGYGIIVTKGGNNEALYVSKTSGSGNAMTVVGGRTSLVDLALSSVTNTAGDFLTISGGVVHKRTAAQTLTDIGGQAALTNPVTGTGTSGQVAYFTGTTAISSESNLFWDATNDRLGIGTNIATQPLQIGNGLLTGNQYLRVFNSASDIYLGQTGVNLFGAGNGQVLATDSTYTSNFSIGTLNLSANLIFGTANIEAMRIFSGQNVHIGPTPASDNGQKLQVSGQGIFTDSANGFNIDLVKTGGFGACIQLKNTSGLSIDLIRVLDSSNNIISRIEPATGGINFAAGNVGIGTAGGINVVSGWTNFVVNGSTTGLIGVKANEVDYGAMYASTGGNNFVIQAYGSSNAGNLLFLTASTERMLITSSGRVLIGTPPPTESTFQLDVNGTGRFSSSVTATSSVTITRSGTSNSNGLVWSTTGSADWYLGSSPLGNATSDLSLYSYGTNSVVLNIVKSTGAATFSSTVLSTRFLNPSGPYGTQEGSARNHFTQFNAGNAGLAGGWISGAFGDALGNRIVIGQYSGVAVIAGHSANLDAWANMALATGGGNVLIGTITSGASKLRIVGLPTSAAGLSSGDVYNLSGVLMIA